MADKEQLNILKQGSQIWNKWRENNPNIKIDLSNANLSNANLSDANLWNANLSDANLIEANLWNANLWNANLSYANLSDANLSDANLIEANLTNVNLSKAYLIEANLIEANLTNVNLINANLTNANLTGGCIQSWILNNKTVFDEIICDYIYLEINEGKFKERRPKDPNKNFASGEFTLVAQKIANPTNIFFEEAIIRVQKTILRQIEFPPEYREAGTSILTYFHHILKTKYPDLDVKVKIEQDGLILRMIIDTPDGDRELVEKTLEQYGMVVMGKMPIEEFLSDPYEIMALKNKLEIANTELRLTRDLLTFKQNEYKNQIDEHKNQIKDLQTQINTLYGIIGDGLKNKNSPIYINGVGYQPMSEIKRENNFSGAKFEGGYAERNNQGNVNNSEFAGGNAGGNYTGNITNNNASHPNLSEAAAEIQQLLNQLSQTYPTETEMEVAAKAVRQIENNPTLKAKIISAVKGGGIEFFKEVINHPAVNIFIAGIEGWKNPN